jgi:hypothetical protein
MPAMPSAPAVKRQQEPCRLHPHPPGAGRVPLARPPVGRRVRYERRLPAGRPGARRRLPRDREGTGGFAAMSDPASGFQAMLAALGHAPKTIEPDRFQRFPTNDRRGTTPAGASSSPACASASSAATGRVSARRGLSGATVTWLFLNCCDTGLAGRMIERLWFEQARTPWSSSPDCHGCWMLRASTSPPGTIAAAAWWSRRAAPFSRRSVPAVKRHQELTPRRHQELTPGCPFNRLCAPGRPG